MIKYLESRKYRHIVLEDDTRSFCNQREVVDADLIDSADVLDQFPANLCPVCESRLKVVWLWQRAEARMSERLGIPSQVVLYTNAERRDLS